MEKPVYEAHDKITSFNVYQVEEAVYEAHDTITSSMAHALDHHHYTLNISTGAQIPPSNDKSASCGR